MQELVTRKWHKKRKQSIKGNRTCSQENKGAKKKKMFKGSYTKVHPQKPKLGEQNSGFYERGVSFLHGGSRCDSNKK